MFELAPSNVAQHCRSRHRPTGAKRAPTGWAAALNVADRNPSAELGPLFLTAWYHGKKGQTVSRTAASLATYRSVRACLHGTIALGVNPKRH